MRISVICMSFMVLSIFLFSCDKENETGDNNLTAKVEGAEVELTGGIMSGKVHNAVSNAWEFNIECIVSNDFCFMLNILGNSRAEVTQIGPAPVFILQYVEGQEVWENKSWNNHNGIPSGEIILNEITDTRAKGTFYFVGFNVNDSTTKSIIQGSFNIPID